MHRLAAFLLLLSTTALAAEPDWYTVEMIIFERIGAASTERWPHDPGFPEISGSVELRWSAAGASRAFTRLGAQALKLGGIYRRLRAMPDLHPVLHVAWRQPGFARGNAKRVHIRSRDADRAPGMERVPTVEGTARLHRSRYLHLLMDLRYFRPDTSTARGTPEAPADDTEVVPGQSFEQAEAESREASGDAALWVVVPEYFRLTETRRMRSRELHYFDHPLFGAIVQIIPYERPKAPQSPPEPSSPQTIP